MSKESREKQAKDYPPLEEQNRYTVETADGVIWVPQEVWDQMQADPEFKEKVIAPKKFARTPEEAEAHLKQLGIDPGIDW